jgi:perosamine synthetase
MLQTVQHSKNVSQVMQVPVNEPWLRGNEEKYVLECIRSGWISSEGSFVKKFEESFAQSVDRAYGIAVSNGSVALDVAMQVLQIGEGDEVILPTFTIISCAAAVVRAGAKPILIDCDTITWNMQVAQIEAKITPRTKAIMIVHIYGLPVDVVPVLVLAKKYNLFVIEDAAEMIGQDYKGKPCGSFGDVSTFSFYANKHITTGEGGMVVVNDAALAERARAARNLFFQPARRYVHEELGNNFRLTNVQAAIGLAQLERLPESIAKKRQIGKRYSLALADLQEYLQLPFPQTDFAENIYWVYGIVVKNPKIKVSELLIALAMNGIGTRAFFWPMHLQPVFAKKGLFIGESYPEAEFVAQQGFYIPSGLALTEEQMDYVTSTLRRLVYEYV